MGACGGTSIQESCDKIQSFALLLRFTHRRHLDDKYHIESRLSPLPHQSTYVNQIRVTNTVQDTRTKALQTLRQ